ncbi:MAG: leucyl aminopeptidase [Zoogloeaceae bacterium]|jgi:leucyl aminopeptidase|nr:leucyl aminopeptidase [Zoogloeaceae bacterium]
MEFSIKSGASGKLRSACVIVGVFTPHKLTDAAKALDEAAQGYLSGILRRGDLAAKVGATLLLHHVPEVASARVLLVSLGKEADFREKQYGEAIKAAVRAAQDTGAADALCCLSEVAPPGRDIGWRVRQAALAASEAAYRFDVYKKQTEQTGKDDKKSRKPGSVLKKLAFCVEAGERPAAEAALQEGQAMAAGASFARDLGNQPGNVCTPAYLAASARTLAKEFGLDCQVLEQKKLEKLGMRALLAVAQGSREPPQFIILRYEGGKSGEKPLVLVGKGITFDSGGISLKPAADMDEMKYDMCGAAAVLGVMRTAATLALPLNLIALIPACENMPDGRATRPGDIVTSLSGQTIEILNTDAEGRLILCDALAYAERFAPEAVIDVATLTGACVVALGHVASGLFTGEEALARELLQAGEDAQDRVWRLPLWDDYQELLKSPFADMTNTGGRYGGAITAACFLSRFAKKYPWAHLDIAGTAWKSGAGKGATGRPVALLAHFLLARAQQQRERGGA